MTYDITEAQTVLRCPDLQAAVDFFRDILKFRIATIYPADDPTIAELNAHGLNLRLERSEHRDTSRLRLRCSLPSPGGDMIVNAPNGTVIELVPERDGLDLPPLRPALVISKVSGDAPWVSGRAGMQYRDLIPGRLGGRFIASHIRIPEGGPVPDYVHYHQIRFQLIYVYKGWVKVVYEDQGEPFIMEAGDCVIQPPLIRHRVLESSPGLEVVEIGCPAEHYTRVDHEIDLPTLIVHEDRIFEGQRFVRHRAKIEPWAKAEHTGIRTQESAVDGATEGLAGVRILELDAQCAAACHAGEFLFWFVLEGTMAVFFGDSDTHDLDAGDSAAIPAGLSYHVVRTTASVKILEVTLPAKLPRWGEERANT